jgi:hypothetical protein
MAALLEVPSLVDDQYRRLVAQVLDQQGAHVIAHGVGVPHCPGQEMLHPIRGGVPGVLGDGPAVLAGQVGKQPAHERLGAPAKLHPGEPAGDPAHHLVEQLLPAGRVDRYAVACGHRLMLGSHTTASSTVAALVRSSAPSLSSQVTIYGWSTSQPLAAG